MVITQLIACLRDTRRLIITEQTAEETIRLSFSQEGVIDVTGTDNRQRPYQKAPSGLLQAPKGLVAFARIAAPHHSTKKSMVVTTRMIFFSGEALSRSSISTAPWVALRMAPTLVLEF